MRRLVTRYSTIEWSADEAQVTKTRLAAPDARGRFRNERRVNELLVDHSPPVATPRLLGHDVQRRQLTFAAVDGEPLGPKYPTQLDGLRLEEVAALVGSMRHYSPRRRWLRRLSSTQRLALAKRVGLLDGGSTVALTSVAERVHARVRFAHGDVTARNLLAGSDGLVLIDWEWAGLYPDGYDLAVLWYSLVDVPEGRAQVKRLVSGDDRKLLLSALLVQLWHLQWYLPAPEHRAKHLATRDELVARLLD